MFDAAEEAWLMQDRYGKRFLVSMHACPLRRIEILALMSISKLLVLPSFTESFSYTLLEAMMCGVPVIATNVSAIPELIGHNGILFNPRESDALAHSILKLLDDERLRRRLAYQAKQAVIKKFSWGNIISKYVKTYEEAQNTA